MISNNKILCGYVSIKRKRFWVIRYVEIYSDSKLYYYYNKGDSNPRAVFDLEQSTVTEKKKDSSSSSSSGQEVKIIQIHTGRDVIQIQTESQKDHGNWFQTIKQKSKGNISGPTILKHSTSSREGLGALARKKSSDQLITRIRKDTQDCDSIADFDLDFEESGIKRAFVYDKSVIQQRFQGDDQLMLKANTSFFISEYKDLVLTKIDEGMKIYMSKMGKSKEQTKEQQLKSPEKEIRQYVINYLTQMKNTLGIPLFCLVFVTTFLLFFIIFYMLFEVFNTSTLILSFLACLNVFILPYVFLRAKKKKKQIENQIFRIKVSYNFPHNLNHFLYCLQQLDDRQKWHPNVKKQVVQKETISLQLTDFDTLTNEIFQITIYSEQKYLYIIEHQKSHILRIFQANYADCEYGNFELQYYSKVVGPKYTDISPFNSQLLIKGICQYITDQKRILMSPLKSYINQQNRLELLNMQAQENNNNLKQSFNLNQSKRESEIDNLLIENSEVVQELQLNRNSQENNTELTQSQIGELKKLEGEKAQLVQIAKDIEDLVPEDQINVVQLEKIIDIPEQYKKYYDLVQEGVDMLDAEIILSDYNQWKKEDSKGTWQMHLKEDGQDVSLRSEDIFNCSATYLKDYICDISKRTSYDDMFKEGANLIQIAEGYNIARNEVKGVFPVSGRDFMMVNGVVEKGNNIYCCARGTSDFDDKYPPSSKIVRGQLKIAGWVIEKMGDNQCKGIFIAKTDPKGNVGKGIKKIGCTKQGKGVKKLREVIEKIQKKSQ